MLDADPRLSCMRGQILMRLLFVVLPVAVALLAWAQAEPPMPDDPAGLTGDVSAAVQAEDAPPPPDEVQLAPIVRRMIDDPISTDDERRRLKLFHGQWEALDREALSPAELGALALLRFELDSPDLSSPEVPARIAAEAALWRGEPEAVLPMLEGDETAAGALLRAAALEQLGRLGDAARTLQPWRERVNRERFDDAAELTAAAQAVNVLARLEGRPAADYQVVMNQLARVRNSIDPLYWPAYLAEGRLLVEKDSRQDGGRALIEALGLNPAAGEVWFELGILAVEGFDFDRAALASRNLRRINPTHPLADRLDARSLLQQRDVSSARAIIEQALGLQPKHREWLALLAAAEALSYDEVETQRVLDHLDTLSPGTPLGYFTVGQVLSAARQYAAGDRALREAIRRQPNWPQAWIERGLLLMQWGDLEAARDALAQASRLDPFNRRANNQLRLVDDLLGYETIETEHFIIRFRSGVDEALARDMPYELEKMHADITAAFQHVPPNKTQIDLMPDERYFGVRITGMPEIWTIAAATGDVLSLTPPREGRNQRGTFDWVNVMRHEFAHTVTLSQTSNRVPHWFTEACAVSQESVGRSFATYELLAWALHNDELFDLASINWGFIRPEKPFSRQLAYAQADWMLEYIAHAFGWQAVIELLELYNRGIGDTEAMKTVTRQNAEEFMSGFRAWATEQVAAWGLGEREVGERAAQVIAGRGDEPTDDELRELLERYPDHPDLLKIVAQRAMLGDDIDDAERAVRRYAEARPVDHWPHRAMAQLATRAGDLERAVPSLEALDALDNDSGAWAHQLAQVHRAAGRLDRASASIRRAVHRQPYNANFRTLAATIELQRGDATGALHQLRALSILEPTRAEHHVRLAALHHRLGDADAAAAAARRARELNPSAPVEAFLP
jgi:tetratricopeptide (TPR) repeat protein